jgi:hypothetical protein
VLGRGRATCALGTLTTQATTLALAEATPDTELLAVNESELKTVETHDTAPANLFRLTRACAALWEKEVWVYAQTVRLVLPAAIVVMCVTKTHKEASCPSSAMGAIVAHIAA